MLPSVFSSKDGGNGKGGDQGAGGDGQGAGATRDEGSADVDGRQALVTLLATASLRRSVAVSMRGGLLGHPPRSRR